MLGERELIKFIRQKDYEVLNPNLGGGSFGKTIIIRDNLIDEIFVCKKYDPYDKNNKEEFYHTFVSEIKIMHKLFHENIVRIYNYYLYPEQFTGYIIMEHINGKKIDDFFSNPGFEKIIDINDIFRQLIDAFTYLENNKIVHRDIRFSNILVTESDQIKIIDFGLGKIVTKRADNTDSFNNVINRNGMELIPEEFEQGFYDSLTDMFCIAELFNRLIKNNSIVDFKYSNVLNKMMKVKRNQRYTSFQDVKNQINRKQLELLNVSEEDKIIYRKFTNSLLNIISLFTYQPNYEYDIEKVSSGLSNVISTNIMEEEIQRNDLLIKVFVKSGFNYWTKNKVEVSVVKDFYDLYGKLNKEDKNLILQSIVLKLGKINIEDYEDDIPF
jgi:serine/threonine-protein kinase